MDNFKFAVFIDGDNISPKLLNPILDEIRKYGEIQIKRIYGDWTTPHMNGWKELLMENPIRPYQQFRYGLNATDNALIMDTIELIKSDNDSVNAICIVSSDHGYYSLSLRLRENGKFVLGIGKKNTKEIFINSCNQFTFIENIVVKETRAPEKTVKEERSLEQIIDESIKATGIDHENGILLSKFGKILREKNPSFDPRDFNHNSLIEIVRQFPEKFRLDDDSSTPPNHWLYLINSHQNEEEYETGTVKRFLNNYGFIENKKGDYYFTSTNIAPEFKKSKIKKGVKVKFRVFREPNKNGESTDEKNGKASNIMIIE